MVDKLIKGALLFTAGAAVGAGAMLLMSDSGKQVREELRNLASQAKDKFQECCEKMKQEVESQNQTAENEPAQGA